MKNEIIIIYKSKTGFTRKYAEMIEEEMSSDGISCTSTDYKAVKIDSISDYNIVVFGTRAHAGRIDGYKKAKQIFQESRAKHFALFVTGATPNTEKKIISDFWAQNLSAEELSLIPHFYLQSGLCYENMCLSDRLMIKAASAMLKNKKEKTAFDNIFEQAVSGSYDISSREYIRPVTAFLKQYVTFEA